MIQHRADGVAEPVCLKGTAQLQLSFCRFLCHNVQPEPSANAARPILIADSHHIRKRRSEKE